MITVKLVTCFLQGRVVVTELLSSSLLFSLRGVRGKTERVCHEGGGVILQAKIPNFMIFLLTIPPVILSNLELRKNFCNIIIILRLKVT